MTTQTAMLHVRIDQTLKNQATETLANYGLTISDAVRILLTRVVREAGLPAGLGAHPDAYDQWFRAKVREAMDDSGLTHSHEDVMAAATQLLERKRGADS